MIRVYGHGVAYEKNIISRAQNFFKVNFLHSKNLLCRFCDVLQPHNPDASNLQPHNLTRETPILQT